MSVNVSEKLYPPHLETLFEKVDDVPMRLLLGVC